MGESAMRFVVSNVITVILAALLSGQKGQQDGPIKIDTDLVSVPVIASDQNGVYVLDLKKEEITVFEDGVQQEIVFF
jgi:hypothetical protein